MAVLVILGGIVVVFWRRLSVVLGLAVIIIAVYILQIASSPYSHPVVSWVFLDLALNPLRIAGVTQAYTLFTSMFLHANLVHLIFNLFALILVGMAFESRIGSTRFFLIAIIAGLVGGLTWAVIHWGQDAFAVGASGAVLGAIGAFARLFGRERLRLILFVVPLPPMPAYLVFVLLLLIDLVIALTSVLPIAAEAHIGGAIAGFLIAPYILKLPTRQARAERPIAIHFSTLEALATTRELKEILDKIEKETVPEVQKVWFTHFMQKARCPKCGGPLVLKGGFLYSECGWRMRL